jgi:A/G-specific adenine glycosylase
MYEFPNVSGHLSVEEAASYVARMGYEALRVRPLPHARHLFSHVEWQLAGYEIQIGQPDRTDTVWIFAEPDEIRRRYAIPSAFSAYTYRIMDCNQITGSLNKNKETDNAKGEK